MALTKELKQALRIRASQAIRSKPGIEGVKLLPEDSPTSNAANDTGSILHDSRKVVSSIPTVVCSTRVHAIENGDPPDQTLDFGLANTNTIENDEPSSSGESFYFGIATSAIESITAEDCWTWSSLDTAKKDGLYYMKVAEIILLAAFLALALVEFLRSHPYLVTLLITLRATREYFKLHRDR